MRKRQIFKKSEEEENAAFLMLFVGYYSFCRSSRVLGTQGYCTGTSEQTGGCLCCSEEIAKQQFYRCG